MTDAEKRAVDEGERIVKGPHAPRPFFHEVQPMGARRERQGPRALERDIKFREVQTAHDDEPRTKGRAYLYFWPGGQTERASIHARKKSDSDGDTMTLLVAPLTGKVTVKNGPVAMPARSTTRSRASARTGGAF